MALLSGFAEIDEINSSQVDLSTKGLHRKAAADAVALKQNEEKKRLCEKLQEVEHLSLSSVFVLKSLHLCQVTYRLFEGDGSSLIIGKRRRLSSSLEKYFDHVSAQSCQVVTCKRINLHTGHLYRVAWRYFVQIGRKH